MDMLDNISKMIKTIPIVNRLLDKVITNTLIARQTHCK